MYAPIKIVIADDHEIFRDGVKLLLKKQNEVELIGEAGDGEELIRISEELRPDLVVTDIKMPVMDGVAATKYISQKLPHVGIIALTMFNEDSLIIEMLEAGAKGYLLKNTNREELVKAIKTVYAGGAYFSNATNMKLTNILSQSKNGTFQFKQGIRFTPREMDVIRLICEEHTNKEIAAKLNISIRTVESYKENIQEKIGAKNVVGIAVYAIKNNILG